MKLKFPFRARLPKVNPRVRILLWAALISLFVGYFEVAEPLDVAHQIGRNYFRKQPVDGSIVVVGIDNRSADALKGFPWSRTYDAQFIDNAFALGAKRIFYDKTFSDEGTKKENDALVKALDRARGKVYFGEAVAENKATGGFDEIKPTAALLSHVELANLNGELGFGGHIIRMAQYQISKGQRSQMMSALLADRAEASQTSYRPDFSIQAASVRTLSYADVVNDQVKPSDLAGKDVVVGAVASTMNDFHWVPGQDILPGVYTHVIGAQTLKTRAPIDLGWAFGFAIGLIASVVYVFGRGRFHRSTALACGFGFLTVAPLFLDMLSITVDATAGLMLLSIVGIRISILNRTHRNSVSDLPNMLAFRSDPAVRSRSIIVMRVHNYAEIVASFEVDAERELVASVAHRLRVYDRDLQVFQGDEGLFFFTSLLHMTEELSNHLDGLHKLMTQPVPVADRKVDLHFGFGVDTTFHTTRSVTTRINSAMVVAVETSNEGEKWKQYELERASGAAWKLTLLGDLDEAVAQRQLQPVFQPKYALRTGQVAGFEVLARWTHPTQGVISPDVFIRAAEDSNRIKALTLYILDDAVAGAARLRKMGLVHSVAVNLSSSLLSDAGLVEMVENVLEKYDFPAQKLTLELTESGRAIAGAKSFAALHALREIGVKLSLDDFGTGNATMDYVQSIPTDELKIDKKFVMGLLDSRGNQAIVEAMIAMAHQLGRSVVAEGIETEIVRQAILEMGCEFGQGFGLARPMAFMDLVKLLRNEGKRRAA
jgi:diguanylate cyclase